MNSVDALRHLVGFQTVSCDSNLELIDWVEDYLSGLGARCRRTSNDEGTKANLLATFGGDGEPGLVLSGHTDVVPANEPSWDSDPFELTGDGSLWYGRGTADMKGFLAVVLSMAPELARASRPIHLAFSYDEEVGCLGAPRMIEDLLAQYPRPELAIVGEPTSMAPVIGHKSVNVFRTRVEGKPAHSSQPHMGAGAILAAGRLIETIWRLGEEERKDPEPAFSPPWTTVQVGTIEGGTALNILPSSCEFQWEYRALPGRDQDRILREFEREATEKILPALREFAPDARIVTREEARIPPLIPSEVRIPGMGSPGVVSFGTEAGLFQRTGIPTMVCGPGSIDQAHRPNEFIEQVQLDACEAFLRQLIG